MEKCEKCPCCYVEAGKTYELNHSFSVNHYFSFRINQELSIVYSYKFICVYIISFYDNITKIGICSYHCRFTQLKPDKECHVAV